MNKLLPLQDMQVGNRLIIVLTVTKLQSRKNLANQRSSTIHQVQISLMA